jgi:hypothetical protein
MILAGNPEEIFSFIGSGILGGRGLNPSTAMSEIGDMFFKHLRKYLSAQTS